MPLHTVLNSQKHAVQFNIASYSDIHLQRCKRQCMRYYPPVLGQQLTHKLAATAQCLQLDSVSNQDNLSTELQFQQHQHLPNDSIVQDDVTQQQQQQEWPQAPTFQQLPADFKEVWEENAVTADYDGVKGACSNETHGGYKPDMPASPPVEAAEPSSSSNNDEDGGGGADSMQQKAFMQLLFEDFYLIQVTSDESCHQAP